MTAVEPRWVPMPPQVALIMAREHADLLRAMEARAHRLGAAGDPSSAGVLLLFIRQARASAREWTEAHRQAAVGRSEVPTEEGAADSERGAAPGHTTGQVAEILGISKRQVINLIRKPDGGLSATWHRGQWLIDELSVAAETERRRNR